MPIRYGDGTGLHPRGFQEVRLGDGTVLYRSGLVDSWEDQDYSEYDLAADGTTADFGVNTTNTQHGVVAAELGGNTSFPKIMSTAGLPNYPGPGDRFEVWKFNSIGTTNATTCQMGTYFGGVDLNNVYYTRNRVDDGIIELMVKENGSSTRIGAASVSIPAGWYRWVIEWDDGATFGGVNGDFTVTVEDEAGAVLGSFTGTDTTYTQGGAGIWGGAETGEHVLWDGYRITNA